MKPNFLRISFSTAFLCFVFSLQAQTFKLTQNHPDGLYQSGDRIQYSIVLSSGNRDSIFLNVKKNNNQTILKKSIFPEKDTLVVFDESFDEPCSVFIRAEMNHTGKSIGSVVEPFKLKPGTAHPKDLQKFWKNEKNELHALKLEVVQKKMETIQPGFVCFDTELNCTGPKPARGYFAKPENAKAKSLPIVLLVHAAGVKGSWCRSEVVNAVRMAQMGKGALCFDLNAHGMLNGQPDEYYNNLEAGELKEYFLQGFENRNDIYFRGMYLRLIRTLDYLTQQAEWDGKRILVIGESQGGGQALAAAGLDKRVSAVVATVPAMCDFGGTLVNRKGGWPQPFEQKGDQSKMRNTLPYFDAAHLLKKSKAQIVVEIGLIDNTCPSTSIYSAINQAKGKKTIYPVSYREHSWPNQEERELDWDKNVNGKKDAFIADYLK